MRESSGADSQYSIQRRDRGPHLSTRPQESPPELAAKGIFLPEALRLHLRLDNGHEVWPARSRLFLAHVFEVDDVVVVGVGRAVVDRAMVNPGVWRQAAACSSGLVTASPSRKRTPAIS